MFGNSLGWRATLPRYLAAMVLANLAWELAQLPFYSIWRDGSLGETLFAVAHCTLGDAGIALASLLLAVAVAGGRHWRREPARFRWVAGTTMLFAVAYTVFSEWINVSVRGSWAYSESMPIVPLLGVGLLPLLQWIATPVFGFWVIRPQPSAA
ncbi:MAG TPA: hypothetical protein VIF14_13920 [Alphaproteobacteria bacterium]|jgi:hypothetical protein